MIRTAVAVTAAALVAVPAALAASSAGPTSVTVRVEGQSRTLLPTTTVKTAAGSITRGGAPAGKCPATSAQGALQDATHGRWTGSWSKQYSEYYLTGILGQTESTAKYYWAIYINNAYAESGACEIPLKKGDTVLFAVVPGKGKTPEVLGVKVPATVKAGAKLAPVVVAYTAKGKAQPLSGATVKIGTTTVHSGNGGKVAGVVLTHPGKVAIDVSKTGYIRTETTVTVS